MHDSYEFLRCILDSITESIVVVDRTGAIVFVNQSWVAFGKENDCAADDDWKHVNYLEECDRAASMGDRHGSEAARGIREVMVHGKDAFYFEYPCHSDVEKRWFMMQVTPFSTTDARYFVISHKNITQRKLAEDKAIYLSRTDGLTDIANRRYFDEFLSTEWRRCARLGMPLTLAFIDIDHFKLFNDTYGHQKGDDCLRVMAQTLKEFARRPGDMCARYGGEEFAMAFGNTTLEDALTQMNRLLAAVSSLAVPHEQSPTRPTVTVSIGLAAMQPGRNSSPGELVRRADEQLYRAKDTGRNRIAFREEG